MNIGRKNIKLFLLEMFSYEQYFLKYEYRDLGTLQKFRFCILLLNFIFPLQTFYVLNLHLNLTIFVNLGMHLGHTFSKIKVIQSKRGHVAHENGV